MTITTPAQKKQALMNLIDDMTASALDRTSQGYSQFLHYRGELIALVDSYMEEDRMRMDFVYSTMNKAQEIFQKNCTNNRT